MRVVCVCLCVYLFWICHCNGRFRVLFCFFFSFGLFSFVFLFFSFFVVIVVDLVVCLFVGFDHEKSTKSHIYLRFVSVCVCWVVVFRFITAARITWYQIYWHWPCITIFYVGSRWAIVLSLCPTHSLIEHKSNQPTSKTHGLTKQWPKNTFCGAGE